MSPLDKKLLRDLWRIKGQAVAIGLVMAVGVLMLVMMSGLVNTLDETKRAYYERYRLADIFAPAVRAPERVLEKIASIPGVVSVEGRITGSALIDLAGQELPLQAQAVSLPDGGRDPRLNNLYLTAGRMLDSKRANEVLLLDGFATANDINAGDTLTATMNGSRRTFRVVGLAQSPEFLYATPPGELAPDDARFAVVWMSRSALAAAFDLKGAFNEVLVSLGRQVNQARVLGRIDRILDPYGGLGAYGLEDQISNRFVSEEINGLRASSVGVPPIFLAVAAFLLYIVVSRIVQSEREQIGLIKAFGYSDTEVSTHYFKLILVIAVGGALAGCAMGIAAGRAMAGLYTVYFKFPFLVFSLDPGAFVTGFLVSVLAASAGGILVLRSVFALTPAVAMRPPAPADFSKARKLGKVTKAMLDQPSRMVLRRLTRQPGRMLGAVLGIGAGMALSAGMISILSNFDDVLEITFNHVDRSDVSITFIHPVSEKTLFELASVAGVFEVEPVRTASVIFRNGVETHRGLVNGLVSRPNLNRALDADLHPIQLEGTGITLSTGLAQILKISNGDILTMEIREGRRPVLEIPVTGLTQSFLGSPAYMEIEALNRALREPGRVSGAYLRIDTQKSDTIFQTLKGMPVIAAVNLKEDARLAFQKLMDQGAGAMRYVMAAIAAIITFGIVYNSARIAYAERARDLASLRVIGFTKSEVAFVLLGELAVITLVALPLGAVAGYYLSFGISAGFSTDLYQIPAIFNPASYGIAALAVIIASVISGWMVKRQIDKADIVSALKTRE